MGGKYEYVFEYVCISYKKVRDQARIIKQEVTNTHPHTHTFILIDITHTLTHLYSLTSPTHSHICTHRQHPHTHTFILIDITHTLTHLYS